MTESFENGILFSMKLNNWATVDDDDGDKSLWWLLKFPAYISHLNETPDFRLGFWKK